MVKCTSHYGTADRIPATIHAIPLFEDSAQAVAALKRIAPELQEIAAALRANGQFCGKADESFLAATPMGQFLLVGLGPAEALTTERLRRAAAQAVKKAAKAPVVSIYCPLDEHIRKIQAVSFEDSVTALAEGALLASYSYDAFKGKKKDADKTKLAEIKLVTADEGFQSRMKNGLNHAMIIAEAVEYTRNLVNAPANVVTPETFAKEAVALGKKLLIKTLVLNRTEITANKMGGLLAVNKGSDHEPRFIIMEYNDKKRRLKPWVLVGKGITFDSGGLSIKPAASMEDMKTDMSGAAAVLGVMMAAAKLKLPARIIGLIPVTDNMTGGSAMCPGDIITMSDGSTVEVLNTDAEGRLILADALVYAQRFKPAGIIDLATLTGAVVVALASHAIGMMGTDEETMNELKSAGERTFERVWQLPLFDEYSKMLESDVADMKNIAGRWGGAITAAAFLKHFAGDTPWVHLDIAGTASIEAATDYHPKGGTGSGVRLLTEFLSGKTE
ncbi:MAG: leucyl aminopeptidase [Bacteroidia bacterium]|nr:leucyl aminopeptidase [Bacteroidia bacterium]